VAQCINRSYRSEVLCLGTHAQRNARGTTEYPMSQTSCFEEVFAPLKYSPWVPTCNEYSCIKDIESNFQTPIPGKPPSLYLLLSWLKIKWWSMHLTHKRNYLTRRGNSHVPPWGPSPPVFTVSWRAFPERINRTSGVVPPTTYGIVVSSSKASMKPHQSRSSQATTDWVGRRKCFLRD